MTFRASFYLVCIFHRNRQKFPIDLNISSNISALRTVQKTHISFSPISFVPDRTYSLFFSPHSQKGSSGTQGFLRSLESDGFEVLQDIG